MTVTAEASKVTIAAATPKVRLSGSEGSAIDVSIRENAGKVEIYDEAGAAVLRTLYPEKVVILSRHLPILSASGGAEIAATVWEEAIFQAPPGTSWVVTDVGVIPDKLSTAFGGATNFFTLGLKDLTGPKTIASKAFSVAATVQTKVSFGTLTSPTIAANDILVIEKSITSAGLICQGCTFYLELTRIS
jgi:hypothetical protein